MVVRLFIVCSHIRSPSIGLLSLSKNTVMGNTMPQLIHIYLVVKIIITSVLQYINKIILSIPAVIENRNCTAHALSLTIDSSKLPVLPI